MQADAIKSHVHIPIREMLSNSQIGAVVFLQLNKQQWSIDRVHGGSITDPQNVCVDPLQNYYNYVKRVLENSLSATISLNWQYFS